MDALESVFNNRYGDITAIPLDIPVIAPDNWSTFWDIWNEQKEPVVNEYSTRGNVAKWEGMDLIFSEEKSLYNIERHFCQDMRDACYSMVERIHEYFPFEYMRGIKLWTNTDIVPVHTDRFHIKKKPNRHATGRPMFPQTFRVMLYDENTCPTFYMASSADKADAGDRHYVSLPCNTNSFVFNDSTAVHGADYAGRTKILLVLQGKRDNVKYMDLMQRSLAKYGDIAMRLPNEMGDHDLGVA